MHELSVSLSIVEIATREVEKARARQVSRIELDIGEIAGIDIGALNFAWEHATKDTVLAYAEKIVNHIPAKAGCLECHSGYNMKNLFDSCPECGSYFKDILSGKELNIKSIVVEF